MLVNLEGMRGNGADQQYLGVVSVVLPSVWDRM